jgi:hypothetical protein
VRVDPQDIASARIHLIVRHPVIDSRVRKHARDGAEQLSTDADEDCAGKSCRKSLCNPESRVALLDEKVLAMRIGASGRQFRAD